MKITLWTFTFPITNHKPSAFSALIEKSPGGKKNTHKYKPDAQTRGCHIFSNL